MDLNEIGRLAKAAQPALQKADSDAKSGSPQAAELLVEQSDFLLKENEKDMEAGRQNGMPEGLLDRLASPKKSENRWQRAFISWNFWKILSEKCSP